MLRSFADNSVDSVVCDPPYGLRFMGHTWDYDVPNSDLWREVLRVLKPGGHVLAFFGPRTYHRGAVQIEDAGFEIRDMINWMYGEGFPKSMDISKAIDKAAGAERPVVGQIKRWGENASGGRAGQRGNDYQPTVVGAERLDDITAPATEAARQWQGWGTAMKPAHEPLVVARKPICGTVVENVLRYGCGGLNIDACRVPFASGEDESETKGKNRHADFGSGPMTNRVFGEFKEDRGNYDAPGRWPANVIHDGSPEVLACFPQAGGGDCRGLCSGRRPGGFIDVGAEAGDGEPNARVYADSGSAARFFSDFPWTDEDVRSAVYCAKANRRDRNEGLGRRFAAQPLLWSSGTQNPGSFQAPGTYRSSANNWPTVKPTALMRHLCRLVTPPRGTVLDPFCGSGSTGKAAVWEGFDFIGIDIQPLAIAGQRIAWAGYQVTREALARPAQMGLFEEVGYDGHPGIRV